MDELDVLPKYEDHQDQTPSDMGKGFLMPFSDLPHLSVFFSMADFRDRIAAQYFGVWTRTSGGARSVGMDTRHRFPIVYGRAYCAVHIDEAIVRLRFWNTLLCSRIGNYDPRAFLDR